MHDAAHRVTVTHIRLDKTEVLRVIYPEKYYYGKNRLDGGQAIIYTCLWWPKRPKDLMTFSWLKQILLASK